jgi:2-polyprenyl-3-methyl-5-hydroxy-6-metoxy-1,4-benzoquinol methylase
MAADANKLQELVAKMLGDVGAAMSGALVIVGDKLNLYATLAESGPVSSDDLAKKTSTAPRYVREWCAAQAASGYIEYDAKGDRYSMTPEQAALFADPNSPTFFPGMFDIAAAMMRDEPKISEAFKTGKGVGWHEHDACLFHGTERFFRPGYAANLISSWLPALPGVIEKLERGAEVADVGCGRGASTLLMAKAYPKSRFVGFDYHQPSIDHAREHAREAGLRNLSFERSLSKEFPGTYDLVAFFDCLHDMGDPVGAAAHVLKSLKPEGTWMIVEPFAGDQIADNLNPIGRVFYSASTMICVPASLSQEVGLALGTQAGEARLIDVIKKGGFTRVRTATATPFNRVIDARP